MSSTLVFDCFSGIAGDMTIAALVDAGASLDAVRAGLDTLGLPPFTIGTTAVTRGGIRALHLDVTVERERTYRPAEMRELVARAALPDRVKARATAAIDWLARGESLAHDTPDPHLHEAGGVDAMVDLVGAMLALEDLDVGDACCPVVTVGAGTIARTEHGPIPAAPGPAAAHILQEAGFALRFVEASHELVTPTGAAILAAVARPGPAVIIPLRHGAGAGTSDPPNRPNALRVFIGTAAAGGVAPSREVVGLEANIDDMPATLLAHARDRLMEEGALDAWLEPIGMKKGRAAHKLCALVPAAEEGRFAALFLAETTTLGVRALPYRRYEAARRIETVATSLGPVRVKVSDWQGRERRSPEFEDVKALAKARGLTALEVQRQLERELGS
ncbi:MAG: LarC family nickel insertion protein [Chloroflexi bacterium]|nr:LarC family nickel insertion protein [Chloroflexota bacterium]